jgi:hypothetical protein
VFREKHAARPARALRQSAPDHPVSALNLRRQVKPTRAVLEETARKTGSP